MKSKGRKQRVEPEKSPKQKRKAVLWWVVDILLIILGACSYSIGLHCFAAPNDIAPGGVGGISTIINEATELSIGLMYALINVPLIIVGLIFLGKKTMIKTVIAVATISFATDFALDYFEMPVYESGDRLLAAIFGGILFGVGLGLIYLREGTSGGTDIINKLINRKFPHFSLGAITLATDAIVVGASAFVYGNIESALYAVVAIFICGKVMDMILYGSFEGKMLLIFSDKHEEIAKYIMETLNRGVTYLNGEGAYSGKQKKVICCAVHKNEYSKLKRAVKEADPNAFIIITNAGEVLGDGFHENS